MAGLTVADLVNLMEAGSIRLRHPGQYAFSRLRLDPCERVPGYEVWIQAQFFAAGHLVMPIQKEYPVGGIEKVPLVAMRYSARVAAA
jgi:hypothetical protein